MTDGTEPFVLPAPGPGSNIMQGSGVEDLAEEGVNVRRNYLLQVARYMASNSLGKQCLRVHQQLAMCTLKEQASPE